MINPSVCVSACLSTCISLEPLDLSARNFVCISPVAVARSSSGSVVISYVIPVLWMTSLLALVGRMAMREPERLLAISYVNDQGGVWCLWMLVHIINFNMTVTRKSTVKTTYVLFVGDGDTVVLVSARWWGETSADMYMNRLSYNSLMICRLHSWDNCSTTTGIASWTLYSHHHRHQTK